MSDVKKPYSSFEIGAELTAGPPGRPAVTSSGELGIGLIAGRRGEPHNPRGKSRPEHIGESFHTEYRDPVHELPYDSGGYQSDWFHTDDLLHTLGENIGCDDFVEDVIQSFGMYG